MKCTNRYAYFWGGELSNFFLCNFEFKGIKFTSSEQAFMYHKAKLFGDTEIASEILKAKYPKEAKALGRKVKNYNDKIWSEKRGEIMYDCCLAKFSQNEALKSFITSDAFKGLHFVEASPYDTVWGIGVDQQNALDDQSNWRGTNLLGKVLDEVRQTLLLRDTK